MWSLSQCSSLSLPCSSLFFFVFHSYLHVPSLHEGVHVGPFLVLTVFFLPFADPLSTVSDRAHMVVFIILMVLLVPFLLLVLHHPGHCHFDHPRRCHPDDHYYGPSLWWFWSSFWSWSPFWSWLSFIIVIWPSWSLHLFGWPTSTCCPLIAMVSLFQVISSSLCMVGDCCSLQLVQTRPPNQVVVFVDIYVKPRCHYATLRTVLTPLWCEIVWWCHGHMKSLCYDLKPTNMFFFCSTFAFLVFSFAFSLFCTLHGLLDF